MSSCQSIYGNSFDEMVDRISMRQNLNLLSSILANSMESKLSSADVILDKFKQYDAEEWG